MIPYRNANITVRIKTLQVLKVHPLKFINWKLVKI
jgi:hypothetical protein